MRKRYATLAGVVLGLACNLNAQTFMSGGLDATPMQSAPPDSIVQITAEAQGLQLIAREDLPLTGTFWLITSNGFTLPMPCAPLDQSLPIYAVSDQVFIIDGTGGLAAVNPHRATSSTVEAVLATQANTVVDLINQTEAAQVRPMMRTMGMESMSSETSGTAAPDFLIPTPDYGTNLWIAQTAVVNGWLTGIGTNTIADISYEIQSRTNLLQTDWQSEGFIYGSELTNWTPFSVAQASRTILFLRLRSWIDSYNIGIPDWWQFQYFGTNGIDPDLSVPGDGYSNLQKFQMGRNPTNYYNPSAPGGFFGSVVGTNAFICWNSETGAVNYLIQRGIQDTNGNYAYTQFLVSSNATWFEDVGAITNNNAQNNIYTLQAVFPGGGLSSTNTWEVWWYTYWGHYGPPYGPPPPSNFWANADATSTNIILSWTPPAGTVTNYHIFHGVYNPTNYDYDYTLITNAAPGTTSLKFSGAITNDINWTESYEIEAVYPGGALSVSVFSESPYGTFVAIDVGANESGLAAPTVLYGYTNAISSTNLFLSWNSAAGTPTGYLIYGGVFDSVSQSFMYHRLGLVSASTYAFEVIGAIDGSGHNIYYTYNVVAVYADSSLSQAAVWWSGSGSPAPPEAYAWLDTSGTNVQISWTVPPGPVTGYLVQRSDFGINASSWTFNPVGQVDASTTILTDVDAVNTGWFDPSSTVYKVQAMYPNGGFSSAVTVLVTNTPAPPGNLSATLDATGTNVLLSWTPALGPTTGYTIQCGTYDPNTGQFSYTQIGTVGANVNSFQYTGAISGNNSYNNVYRVRANYAGGNNLFAAAQASASRPSTAPGAPNLNVTAQLVRNETGRWQLMFSGITTNMQAIALDWYYWDYWYDIGPFPVPELGYPFSVETDIAVSSLTNGIYVIPDDMMVNALLLGNVSGNFGGWTVEIGVAVMVQPIAANGDYGNQTMVGFLPNEQPAFADGRQCLKQNLLFALRSADLNQPNTSLSVPVDTNYVESSIFHWAIMDKGYNTMSASFLAKDDLWPFTANYLLHPNLYDPNYTGPTSFNWSGSLTTTSAPAILGVSAPYWIAQPLFVGSIDPATGLPIYGSAILSTNLPVYTNGGSLYFQSGAHNLFGLAFETALVKQDPQITIAPGGSTAMTNVNCFYSQTADPSLQLVNYYFAPVNSSGTSVANENPINQPAPIPALTGFANTNQTGVMIASVGTPTVIGGWAKFGIQNGSSSKFAYLGQYYVTNAFVVTNGNMTTTTTGVVSPYGDFFPTEPGMVALKTLPDIDTGTQGTGIVRVVSLNVDANHDGTMNFKYSSPDFVSAGKPFRFWVNDNQDSGDYGGDGIPRAVNPDGLMPTGTIFQQVPPTYAAQLVNVYQIHGRRDLVDFFPVYLNIGSLFQSNALSAGINATDTNYQFVLSQADSVLRFTSTSLTPTNYLNFLQDTNVSGSLAGTWLTTIPSSGVGLSPAFVGGIARSNQGIILVEAAAPTTQPLVLTIYHGTNQIAQTSLPLSITGVEQMFRHKNLLLNIPQAMPDRLTDASVPNEPETIDKNFVFLHGYNVLPDEARGVAADMFKRMYWSGSHAKFYAVTWEGADTKGSLPFRKLLTPNYHTNVYNAFLTAPSLANFISSLTNNGPVVVTAHSLGNMVTLSAINDWNAPISQYFMLDAAVPIEAIDPSSTTNMMVYSTWLNYSNRLFAANWYQLFLTNDARSKLTWNGRLSNLGNVDVYNYYSSGEEVLRTYIGDPPADMVSLPLGTAGLQVVNNLFHDVPFGTGTWYWQEKGKGTGEQDWFLYSSHGGWQFNNFYSTNIATIGIVYQLMSPIAAAQLSDSQLKTNSFFDLNNDHDNYTHIPYPDAALLGSGGSTYAAANRNRILADAIPAMSLVVGANPISSFDNNHNKDLMALKNSWSQGRTGREAGMWHHSDFVQMAYTFAYPLFNQFVTIGNLK